MNVIAGKYLSRLLVRSADGIVVILSLRMNKMTSQIKVVNGTSYPLTCPDQAVSILERFRMEGRRNRIKIYYGNLATGQYWGVVETGYVGRSTGTDKIPLICHNQRSLGGEAIICSRIMKIEYANRKNGGVLYQVEGAVYHAQNPQIASA